MAEFKDLKTKPGHLETKRVKEKGFYVTRHRKRFLVKAHDVHRNGQVVHIPQHYDYVHQLHYHEKGRIYKRQYLAYGGGFKELADRITKEYENKARKGDINPRTGQPYTMAEAKQIGPKTAADIYFSKNAHLRGKN